MIYLKFTVGYQIDERNLFVPEIISRRDKVKEVYFAYGDFANGRGRMAESDEERLFSDLEKLHDAGIDLNLLLNANCYGADSLTRTFFEKIGDTVDWFRENFGLSSVTTTSPVIAKFVKNNFSSLEIRASVNMGIGTTDAAEYLGDTFDSYYLAREANRNLNVIKEMSSFCRNNGKKLYMLANSGCLNHCPAHTFHDNLVSHENEIMKRDNAFTFKSLCRERISSPETMYSLLRDTNFVRPEDIAGGLFDEYFDMAKLATRVNQRPLQILIAYTSGKYIGNLAELLEPDHSSAIYPYVLENTLIPSDFTAKVMACDKKCEKCNYCKEIFKKSLNKTNEGVFVYVDKQND